MNANCEIIYLLKNNFLQAQISNLGCKFLSVRDQRDYEYLWWGDDQFWSGRSFHIFPYVGRLTDNKFIYRSNEYLMGIHGILSKNYFEATHCSKNSLEMRLIRSKPILFSYPFQFDFKVKVALIDNKIEIKYRVENIGKDTDRKSVV